MLDEFSHPIAKLFPNLLDGHISVFDSIVQDGRSQHFLVIGYRSHDAGGLHGMDDVGISLAASLRSTMGFDGKFHSLVEESSF
jgi:hypothetical protein